MAKQTRAKRARRAARNASTVYNETEIVSTESDMTATVPTEESTSEVKMESDGMLQADLLRTEEVAGDEMDVEATVSSSGPEQVVPTVELSEFQQARQALIFEKALEIEKGTYWNAAKIRMGYEITAPSEASLETARTYVDNQYMQQSISNRTTAIKAELEALRKDESVPSTSVEMSVEMSVDDLAKALHRTLKLADYDRLNEIVGGNNSLTPNMVEKQKEERGEDVSEAARQRVVSGREPGVLDKMFSDSMRFNPQFHARKTELAALSTPAGNSHHTAVEKVRRAGVIERTLDNQFQTIEAVESARVKETARRVSKPGC